jgi:TonB family protein
MINPRILICIYLLCGCLLGVSGQAPGNLSSGNWTRIESKSKDFSVALPEADYLVNNDGQKVSIWYFANGCSFSITMEKDGNAKSRFSYFKLDPADKTVYKSFKLGNSIGRWHETTVEKAKVHFWSFDIATSKGYYTISARLKGDDITATQRFLRSIRLEGKQIIDSTVTDPIEQQTVPVISFETSGVIKQALRQRDPTNLKLEKDVDTSPPPGEVDEKTLAYSRSLVILSKPRASYTDSARMRNISGMVKVKVNFLANGTIGSIAIVKSLDKDLDRQAFEAARQIKFLPAEIDGKPVDSVKYVEYSFEIH